MTVPLSDTRLAGFGVVLDYRPDADRVYAWGPFVDEATAARFAEFATAEIDPARVIPWEQATALPGARVLDPVAELLTWRTSIALPQRAELAEARAKAFRDGADAVMQSSHGEPLRDTHSGLMRACGLLHQLAREAAPTT